MVVKFPRLSCRYAVALDVVGAGEPALIVDVYRERAAHGIRDFDRGEDTIIQQK